MRPDEIGGVLPVLYSFFDDGGNLRLDGFRHQCEHCLANGANGVVLFGFVTQFYRLSFAEKVAALRETARSLEGRGTLGVTIMEASVAGQMELIRVARDEGADWVILQPPLGPPARAPDWMEMLKPLIDEAGIPVAVQNALIAGTCLSNGDLITLQTECPNLMGVKAETSSEDVAAFARNCRDRFRILTGNWGVEYPFFLRSGVHGVIPAPNFVKEQVALHKAAIREDWEKVDQIHAQILPLMQFIRERPAPEEQIILGKQAYSWRTSYTVGTNRKPGPASINSHILAHAHNLLGAMMRQSVE
ncbi:dihydrodipicolinate synthase family protein [Roseibium sediminicola]|uniref:Dihydrodipicolinate synthase family protein n=1 Tax=Roseibium sediminicola TaxID=2933272 RepID=A0ABT0H1Y8_9HYPH|nr:dihydrodipicolinate synthase family protein [Roseibium sp. CAU 1639]MCK7615708.1 dihydrodipicolinate synthase family protein [Roseibium sp. CAU 1639]